MTQDLNIGFIGAGNMTRCLISGLIANEYSAKHIWASNPTEQKLQDLTKEFGIHNDIDNAEVAKNADVLILAVKPQNSKKVCLEIAPIVQKKKPLVISLAIGISEKNLSEWLGGKLPVVRTMANIAALVNGSATTMYANSSVSPMQRDLAESILRAVGMTLWIEDEHLIEVAGALAGSGPAYFFLVMEALEDAAVKCGLAREEAHLLILQTTLGAARLALSTDEPLKELRQRVTSRGGITERALTVLEDAKIRDVLAKALNAAKDRSIEIAEQYS